MLSAAYGGQVLLSAAAGALADSSLPDGAALRDLGMHRLRDLPLPERIYQLTAPALPEDFPPLRTPGATLGNLPVPLTSFVGRERERAELSRVLERARLLTLTGSGGTGKTRLALEVAREQTGRFPDGAWLVELAPITAPGLVVHSIAAALSIREQPGRPLLVTLKDAFATSEALLLLDNCEHLLDVCAALVADLLQSAPSLKVLATSREPLGVSGEVTYQVVSLSLPDPGQPRLAAELMQYEAVRLLVERAKAAQPAFRLTDSNGPALARICQRLDGIPLAIELAATRLRTLSPEQIAARLDDYFSLLTGGSRSALPRQQTLRALIDWSHDLLTEPERALLRRLSVFSGGWTLEAAEAVGGGKPELVSRKPEAGGDGSGLSSFAPGAAEGQMDVLDTLARLVDRSLVIAEMPDVGQDGILPYPPREARYRLLEMIRQYAREKLLASGESAMVRDRHLAFYADLAGEAEMALHGPEQAAWLARLDAELDNLRAAMEWAMGAQPLTALRVAANLRNLWTRRGLATEGRRWLGDALQRVQETSEPPGEQAAERTRISSRGLATLANLLLAQGEYGPALQAARQGVELARASGREHDLLLPLAMFALLAGMNGHAAEARAAADELLALRREPGDEVWVGMMLGGLGFLAANIEGDYDRAIALYRETLARWQQAGNVGAIARCMECLGFIATARGEAEPGQERLLEHAARLFGAAEMLRDASASPMRPEERTEYEQITGRLMGADGRPPAPEVLDAWREGRAMTRAQAIEYALRET